MLTRIINQKMSSNKPLVSIIIPTKNSAEYLSRCLKSVRNQTYKNIEIILVDQNSTDNTVDIAKKFDCHIFCINANERCDQFNFGVKKSTGQYIYIIGSDFVLDAQVVEQAVAKCEIEGYDALYIHNTSDPTISVWSKIRKFERDMYRGDDLNVAARFFKRDVYVKLGGYDEKLVAAEDYDLHNRLIKAGYKVTTIEAEETHIGEPKTIKEVFDKHYYYGKTLGQFMAKNEEVGAKQLTPIRPAFLRHWFEFIRHPLLGFGFFYYQFVKYLAGGLGYISAKYVKGAKD
ncbi:MAG: glycosyltransferase [Candidatus Berkelbacteria bacterium]